jgi:hypothetical protein
MDGLSNGLVKAKEKSTIEQEATEGTEKKSPSAPPLLSLFSPVQLPFCLFCPLSPINMDE